MTGCTISFLLASHTRFAPDWRFGLLKQKFRKTKVSSLNELAANVEQSSVHTQYCTTGGTEDGTSFAHFYNWTSFLKPHFQYIQNTTLYRHYTITSDKPGIIQLQLSESEKKRKDSKRVLETTSKCLPQIIPSPGLSAECQWYHLYDNIRPF